MNPKEVFRSYCKKNALRYTAERDMIIEEVYRKDCHFDIDSLFLAIRNRNPHAKLAKGSIYRTLPHLKRSGLIRESFTEDGHIAYEHTLGHEHHDHMRCLGCGKVFEFYDDSIDRIQQELCEKRKFKMIWHVHVIRGYCLKCRKSNQSKK